VSWPTSSTRRLGAPDALAAHRLRRNAASALAGLRGEAIPALCARLDDEREQVRGVAAMALGVMEDPAVSACVRDWLASATPPARPAAEALRQRVVRGLFPVGEAWALTATLLTAPDPEARRAGLFLAPVFAAAVAEPAVRPLLDDPDPEVAEAAREARGAIERVLQADQLRGEAGS
jgi:HEAT repeat protein